MAKEWVKTHMHSTLIELLTALNLKFRGHCQYYGVNGNIDSLKKFREYLYEITLKALRRRSQVHRISWQTFSELWEKYMCKVRIYVDIWYTRQTTFRECLKSRMRKQRTYGSEGGMQGNLHLYPTTNLATFACLL